MAEREHLLESEKGGEIAEMTFYYSQFALYGRQRRRAQSVEFFLGLDDSPRRAQRRRDDKRARYFSQIEFTASLQEPPPPPPMAISVKELILLINLFLRPLSPLHFCKYKVGTKPGGNS